ncbi:YciI family protein [Actinophytocola sp.]|uniref:YciI family protein n=1 Tax=Actinophytocola sp. TaxID=1872138 RepID=UPI002D7E8931|nr:YciI family protein [Actinophytocola sp.]HET9142406.1 YciI family protein [Actinophytocola sp.]
MRFMTMVKGPENAGPPPQALMEAIAELGREATKAGVLVESGGLGPSALGARIRLSGGKLSFTDGPFSGTKELIGGYAVYEVKSREEALEWARRFMEAHRETWPGWEGETEIRQVFTPDDV